MFRYAPKNQVYWPVTLKQRTEDGQVVESTGSVLYQLVGRDEYAARDAAALSKLGDSLAAKISKSKDAADAVDTIRAAASDVISKDREEEDFVAAHIVGWDFLDADDTPLPFSPELLRVMFRDPLLWEGLRDGLRNASFGAKAKNSSPGPDGTAASAQATTA